MFRPRITVFLALLAAAWPSVAGADALSRDDVEAIIEQHLVDNPDIVIRALEAWERQREEREQEEARRLILRHTNEIHDDPDTPIGGDAEGDIVIVEFFDYRCGFCRRSAPALFAVRDAVAGVRVVYKEFPILGEDSVRAARAALAAREQGLYEPFHEFLMTEADDFSQAGLMEAARAVGLDEERLADDMEDPAIDAYLQRTHDLAATLGINATPSFIIDGELHLGALGLADLEAIIGRGVP